MAYSPYLLITFNVTIFLITGLTKTKVPQKRKGDRSIIKNACPSSKMTTIGHLTITGPGLETSRDTSITMLPRSLLINWQFLILVTQMNELYMKFLNPVEESIDCTLFMTEK